MKKEQLQNEAIEVLNSPATLEDEVLSSVTGGCDEPMVSCICGLIEYEQNN